MLADCATMPVREKTQMPIFSNFRTKTLHCRNRKKIGDCHQNRKTTKTDPLVWERRYVIASRIAVLLSRTSVRQPYSDLFIRLVPQLDGYRIGTRGVRQIWETGVLGSRDKTPAWRLGDKVLLGNKVPLEADDLLQLILKQSVSAVADGPRDAACPLKSYQLLHETRLPQTGCVILCGTISGHVELVTAHGECMTGRPSINLDRPSVCELY